MFQVCRTCLFASGLLLLVTPVRALDLTPISSADWTPGHAAHLASRAGFGASSFELQQLADLTPGKAVDSFINGQLRPRGRVGPFVHSGVFEPGLDPFPPSRPATTALAKRQGHALGVKVKVGGNRPLQPVVNKFFYWLRASRLETDRVAYWWANRMLATGHPLQEKMALFWHGHFASNEDKVRDYRKMLGQLQLFQEEGLGPFRNLLVKASQDPAMLVFLDAGINTKDHPNENFAREIMEMFTMGEGNYSESDVREAARAFTGWNYKGLEFNLIAADHDAGTKTILGKSGQFSGVQVIDVILEQPVAAEYIAGRLYEFFVNDQLQPGERQVLGRQLRAHNFHIGKFLRTIFLSRDFYRNANIGTRIKSPVELLISTYRRLGLAQVPGVPDFNLTAQSLGQRLMHPPTVAGWARGRSWITPGLMFERGNFALDLLFPDIGFVPQDRYPGFPSAEIVHVQNRLRQGMSISAATRPTGLGDGMMAASNMLADRDEAFNTRLGTMRGWQMALERVRPIARHTARLGLTDIVLAAGLRTPRDVVDYWVRELFLVSPDPATIHALAQQFAAELGTEDVASTASFMEEPVRKLLHQLLSLPEYQLG